MPNIILMFHTQQKSDRFKASIKNFFFNAIEIPISVSGYKFKDQIQAIHNSLLLQRVSMNDIHSVFVESNYGKPSEPVVNRKIFEYFLAWEAKIIAVGNTPESLIQALGYHKRIFYMSEVRDDPAMKPYQTRLHSFVKLKKKKHPACKRMLSESCDDSSRIDINKLRGYASLPVTPIYHARIALQQEPVEFHLENDDLPGPSSREPSSP